MLQIFANNNGVTYQILGEGLDESGRTILLLRGTHQGFIVA
jgi:hypothetical protein